MQRRLLLIGSILLAAFACKSQPVEGNINAYGAGFPVEKISLHFDKEAYFPGEVIWFKAYLFKENLPSSLSTNFYAALYDEKGKLLQQMWSPIVRSSTDGHFDIPDSIKSHQITFRAYTSWILSSDSSSIYTKAIKLILPAGETAAPVLKSTISLQFFPEGGDIIEGTKNTIAFKASLNNGMPVDVSGIIKNKQTGAEVMPFKSTHDGMGRFDLEVENGDHFFAEWTDMNGVIHETALPVSKPVGVSLKMTRLKENVYYNIVNTLPGDSLHVLMYIYQDVFYSADISVKEGEPFTGMVWVNSLPTGVMKVTVFDASWQPVAERVAFVNNNNFSSQVAINNTELNIKRRGKNSIEVSVPDKIPFNLSLSITDAELNGAKAERNIFTDMLLAGDVKGYIHNPAYYFTNNNDATIAANLDLVMLTHGWRRYNPKDVNSRKTPSISTNADSFLTLKGKVSETAMQKIKPKEKVTLIINTKDSTNSFYFFTPDQNGHFSVDGLMFFDSAKVLFSFKKKKFLNQEISLSNNALIVAKRIMPGALMPGGYGVQPVSVQSYLARLRDSSRFYKNLDNVVVKHKRDWRADRYQMDKRYTSSLFSGLNGYSYDVVHDESTEPAFDVYDYVRKRVPGIRISFDFGGKKIVSTDGIPIAYFINERQVDNVDIGMLEVDDLAYIKYIDRYTGLDRLTGIDSYTGLDRLTGIDSYTGLDRYTSLVNQGIPHALAFYFRKGADLKRRAKDMQLRKVEGYTPIKEFYSPDYAEADLIENHDNRNTLLWVPYITTTSSRLKVPITFYNNDFSTKLKLVLEGINDQGKLVHIEKILE